MNHNFHTSETENPQRFLNAVHRGSYCRPHRHVTPPKVESFIILNGRIAFLLFDDQGTLIDSYRLGENGLFGVDVAAGLWHSIVALSDTAVCYEVKPGPYASIADKDFARWSPSDGSPEAQAYLTQLEISFGLSPLKID